MKITIVIPTYNEVENIPVLVDALFSQRIPDLQILIVDDNSPDGCGRVADDLHEKYGNSLQVLHRQGK